MPYGNCSKYVWLAGDILLQLRPVYVVRAYLGRRQPAIMVPIEFEYTSPYIRDHEGTSFQCERRDLIQLSCQNDQDAILFYCLANRLTDCLSSELELCLIFKVFCSACCLTSSHFHHPPSPNINNTNLTSSSHPNQLLDLSSLNYPYVTRHLCILTTILIHRFPDLARWLTQPSMGAKPGRAPSLRAIEFPPCG